MSALRGRCGGHFSRGMILLPVVVTLLLVAVVAGLLRLEAANGLERVAATSQAISADYVLEAATAHARWALLNHGSCSGYGLPATAFGDYDYQAQFAPDNASPVDMTVTATAADGTRRTSTLRDVVAYEPLANTMTVAATSDAYVDSNNMALNYGAATVLEADAQRRVLVDLNLGGLPAGVHIESAALELRVDNGGGLVRAYPLRAAWTEGNCDGGDCTMPDGVTWQTRDGSTAWLGGGEFDGEAAVEATAVAGSWARFDMTALAREWADGTRMAQGVIVVAANGADVSFVASEHADAALRPRLELRYRCACGVDCVPAAVSQCDADFVPNTVIATLAGTSIGVAGVMSTEWLPAGADYAGATAPDGGAVLVVDWTQDKIVFAAPDGSVLASHATVGSTPRGVAWLGPTHPAGRIAVSDYTAARIDFHGADGSALGNVSTSGYTSAPEGLAYLDDTVSGTYDGTLAIATRLNKQGNLAPAVHLVSTGGTLQKTIDVSAYASWPNGVAHLPGSDKLLLLDRNLGAFIIDFDGNLLSSYATTGFGLSDRAESSIDTASCNHVLTDWGSQTIYVLGDLEQGLLAHWRLDANSGTTATDSVGGNDGVVAQENWVSGVDGNALDLATGDVRIEDATALDLERSFTIALWFRHANADGVLLSKGQKGSDLNYHLSIRAGQLEFAYSDGSLRRLALLPASFDNGSWHQVVVAYDAAVASINAFVDGVAVASAAAAAAPVVNSRALYFGSSEFEGDDWNGAIDDVRLYAFAFDATRAAALFGRYTVPVACGGRFADDFASGGFGGSSGDLAWDGAWLEWNEADGPASGDILIGSNGTRQWLQLQDNDGGGEGAGRIFDATGHTQATLTLTYRRQGLDDSGDYVAIFAGDPATMSGTEVGRIQGPGNDASTQTLSIDLSAYANQRSGVLLLTSPAMGGFDQVLFDSVHIDVSGCP